MAVYLSWKFVFEFDLVELYLYLIPKCVFAPNPGLNPTNTYRSVV